MDTFHKSDRFLKMARAAARRTGYDPAKLKLSLDGKHKLVYESPEGLRRFGASGYGDYLYYSVYEPQIADQKRSAYRARAGAANRIHGVGKYSPGALAISILW